MKRYRLIMYDIRDAKRIRKVARILEQVATRVQRSVYECHISDTRLALVRKDIAEIIEPEDVITYLALCERDWQKRRAYGVGAKMGVAPERPYRIV
jgi:CRISPR-associated protein Cas2